MSYLDAMTQSCDDSDPLQQTNRIWFQKSELRGHGGNFRHLQQKIKTMIARVCDYCMNDIGAVYSTKFSPCGRLLASGSLDCRVLLWDVTTKFNKQQLASLNHHSQLVIDVRWIWFNFIYWHYHCVVFSLLTAVSRSWSNDSRSLLSASYDHTVNLWDTDKAQLSTSVGVNGLVQTVSFNPAGRNKLHSS